MAGIRKALNSTLYRIDQAVGRFEPEAPAEKSGGPRLERLEVKFEGRPFDPLQARTEDLRLSPDGGRVVIISTAGKILLFDVDLSARPVVAEYLTALVSPDIHMPHGIDWIDDEHIVVANRRAGLAFFRVPRANRWDAETKVETVSNVQSSWFGAPGETRPLGTRKVVTGPGSVRVCDGSLIVACNMNNTVTRHEILPGPSCSDGELVAQQGLEIPEGASVSADGAWLAVADHDNNRVVIFRAGEQEPAGQLTDANMLYPHGTAFDPTGTVLVASDAGTRLVHVFHAPDGDWGKDQTSVASSVTCVSRAVFNRVQRETAKAVRRLEGGTKGVDISQDGRMVLTTSRGQTLRAFVLHV